MESGSDPVLWHCFGLTHIVRPEDFPVMPVESAGFTLKPVGFFRGNPGIDIPYQPNAASKLCCGTANGQTSNGQTSNGNSADGSSANGHANGHTNGHANGHADGGSDGVQDAVQVVSDAGSMHVVQDAIKAAAAESGAGSMNGILNGQATEVASATQ